MLTPAEMLQVFGWSADQVVRWLAYLPALYAAAVMLKWQWGKGE